MPRIIFTSRYLSQAPITQLANLVEYMGTRPGVELCPAGWPELPATEKQQALITRLRGELPDVTTLPEYAEYQQQPNRESASKFISTVMEQYADQIVGRGEFVRYMGMRPGVEKLAAHGLFSQTDESRSLNEIVNEVAGHQGIVWSHVLSLRREDAARLGYDNQAAYKTLLRNSLSLLAEGHKIDPANLRWMAAYHNEDSHPHVHLLVYSSDPAEGYLTNTGIERMRGGFAKIIFQDTLKQLYDQQTDARDALREKAGRLLKDLTYRIDAGDCADEQLETMLTQLRDRLQAVPGKRIYQYLLPDVKRLVNMAVDRLAENAQIAALYKIWQEQRRAILETYTDTERESQPLSRRKEFRPVQNMVIRAALSLSSHSPMEVLESGWDEDSGWPDERDGADLPPSDCAGEPLVEADEPAIKWSDAYKAARKLWYNGGDDRAGEAYGLMLTEARKGNILAVYDVGKMKLDGIGCEKDTDEAQQWFQLALSGFMEAEQKGYIQYRIGKMHALGYGTEQDYTQAAGWYAKAVKQDNPFAAYALGGLYHRGQGVDKDEAQAFSLYSMAAEHEKQPNAYAMYELGGMYRDGRGTERDAAKSKRWYSAAYTRFVALEQERGDENLAYRLGRMNLSGIGTSVNFELAKTYLGKSAVLKNVNAYYGLGTLYLKKEYVDYNPQQATFWFAKAADAGHDFAEYSLGKLYLKGEGVPKDTARATTYLERSAAKGNQYAEYALGKLFFKGEDVLKDTGKALFYLERSAAQGNQYAEYTLGKLYLFGIDVPEDRERALYWLHRSAAQGNQYASRLLEHTKKPSVSPQTAVLGLLQGVARLLDGQTESLRLMDIHTDSKLLAEMAEKRAALGYREGQKRSLRL